MLPLSIQDILHETHYAYSPSYRNKVASLGFVIGLIGLAVGACALNGSISLNRSVSYFVCIGMPLTSALIVYLITSKKVYTFVKHGICSVSAHNNQWKEYLGRVQHQLKTTAGYVCAAYGNEMSCGHVALSTAIESISTTFSGTRTGQNDQSIDFFCQRIVNFIDLCSRGNRPIWITFNLAEIRNLGADESLNQTVTISFFTAK